MKNQAIYVIDFEGSTAGGIVEYGLLGLQLNGYIFEYKTRLCKTNRMISKTENKLHGISNADISNEAPFFENLPLFIDARNRGVLCAHNATFENQLLTRYCPILKGEGTWGPWLDTYGLYKNLLAKNADCQLSSLIIKFNLAQELDILAEKFCPSTRRHYHCALYDALACTLLLLHYVNLPQNKNLTLDSLFTQSACGTQLFNDRNQQKLF